MAKKSSIEKNRRRQKLAKQFAGKRARLKALIMNKEAPIEERFNATLKLAQMPRAGAPSRIRNRCEVTGRPRAFYRKLKVSRIAMRELGNKGLIPGLLKSSW
jgi:small subunit ribosomal protein S14